jgi:hypothetical protein
MPLMLPLILWTFSFLPLSILQDHKNEQRPTIFIEDRALAGIVRNLAGGWVDVIDCSSNPRMQAQQICACCADLDLRKIIWLYEDGQDETNPNLWRERLAGQGVQVRSVTTIRNRNGELEYLKSIPNICKLLVESYPDLTWYFHSRRSLVEQHLNAIPFPNAELIRPNHTTYAN